MTDSPEISGSHELEDGIGVEHGVLGAADGGASPVEKRLPGGFGARLVEAQKLPKELDGFVGIADGLDGVVHGLPDGVVGRWFGRDGSGRG